MIKTNKMKIMFNQKQRRHLLFTLRELLYEQVVAVQIVCVHELIHSASEIMINEIQIMLFT